MGGSKQTTTTTVTRTPEEIEYTKQQIELAKQQLRLVEEEHGWQGEIFALTKPLLEKYALLVEQDYNELMSPEYQTLRDKQRDLEAAQVDSAIRNLPLQDEMLQLQLDEIRRGGRATDEQKLLINQIADRAIAAGDVDIGRFMTQGLDQIRDVMAPARGMRPDDAPIVDAGEKVLEEALRQKGQLTQQVRGAAANAELNFPLNASQVYGNMNQWQQNFNQNMNTYLSQLKQQAYANRANVMGQLFTSPMSVREQGLGLINATRPNPVDFPRNTTTVTKTSGGSILGGIGGFLSGIGSVGSLFSTREAKTNIRPMEAPPGHMLSPGAIKKDFAMVTSNAQLNGPQRTAGVAPVRGLGFGSSLTARDGMYQPGRDGPSLGSIVPPPIPQQPADPKAPPNWAYAGGAPTGGPSGAPPQSNEDALNRLVQLPVSTWEYKPETGLGGTRHIGPMAEDFNTQVMGKPPEPFINTVDAVGSLTAAVKALDERTRPQRLSPPDPDIVRRRKPRGGVLPPRGRTKQWLYRKYA